MLSTRHYHSGMPHKSLTSGRHLEYKVELGAASRLGQRSVHGGSNGDLNGGSFALSPSDITALRQGHPLFRCLNVLNHVMQQPAAASFCSQVHGLSFTLGTERFSLQQRTCEHEHYQMNNEQEVPRGNSVWRATYSPVECPLGGVL